MGRGTPRFAGNTESYNPTQIIALIKYGRGTPRFAGNTESFALLSLSSLIILEVAEPHDSQGILKGYSAIT